MQKNIHILSASGNLRPYIKQINKTTQAALKAVEKLLPIKSVDVVFYENPVATIDEIGGIGGFTQVANLIFISLNPKHKYFKEAIKENLFKTLIHEFHHAIRWQKPVKETLLEAIISEGLADHFVIEATGVKMLPLWSNILSERQNKLMLQKAKKEWLKSKYDHSAWFFGAKKSIPRWAGYTLGFELVKNYLQNHPKAKPSNLVFASAKDFID